MSETSKVLVCGVCEEVLPGTYGTETEAEQAVDEHKDTEHGDLEDVVVVHVSQEVVDLEGEDGLVDIAIGAQQRLEDGEAEELGLR
jgi:hypothetical protein